MDLLRGKKEDNWKEMRGKEREKIGRQKKKSVRCLLVLSLISLTQIFFRNFYFCRGWFEKNWFLCRITSSVTGISLFIYERFDECCLLQT